MESIAAELGVDGTVTCIGARKQYGLNVVLDDVDLAIKPGEFVCLLGPSGCGKTTLLNCIAGFTPLDSGSVNVGDRTVRGPGADRGVVFQDHGLFPWLTVRENVETGPRLSHASKAQRAAISDRYLEMVHLSGKGDLYPSQLSGGMKQRVGIARALANEPKVLLMDEPFGALDAITRQRMQDELLDIWRDTGTTVVFVTHDVAEAAYLADRVVVMAANPGRIERIVSVELDRPRSRTTSDFSELVRELETLLHPTTEEVR